MADDEPDVAEEFETKATVEERQADAEMRAVLSDTYTFVRSAEINKTILSFTFDHYIDEAKRSIKQDRILRSASNATEGVGKRPSKLSSLEKLEQDFNNALAKIQEVAKAKDSGSQETT